MVLGLPPSSARSAFAHLSSLVAALGPIDAEVARHLAASAGQLKATLGAAMYAWGAMEPKLGGGVQAWVSSKVRAAGRAGLAWWV